jgi:hypothetical protein
MQARKRGSTLTTNPNPRQNSRRRCESACRVYRDRPFEFQEIESQTFEINHAIRITHAG